MQKKLIGAQISALLGAMPAHIYHSCGMTGERRDIDKSTEIKSASITHCIDPLSGVEVHSPASIVFDNGEYGVTTTGALAAGNLGMRMTSAERNVDSIAHLIGQGCKIIGPDGKEINFD